MRNKTNRLVRNMVFSAICLALCLVLPFVTGQVPQIGSALCPMHLPVLLAGFICSPWWALAVGAIAPLLRHLIFSMPPMPGAIPMSFELLTYGLTAGILWKVLPKKPVSVYIALAGAMIAGRAVWGIASVVMFRILGNPFTWEMFAAGAVLNAIPGIIAQIILVPVLVLALRKAGFTEE